MPGEIDFTVQDGGLGVVAPTSGGMHTVLGHAVGGTANVLKIYGRNNIAGLLADYTGGVAVESAAFALKNGAPQVGICKTATSVAGTISSVTTGGGATATVTPSGTPTDDLTFIVKASKGGAVATATFQYSTDGGDTWSGIIATVASFPVPGTGVTLAMTGTFTLGETHTFTTKAPAPNATDIGTALDALQLDNRDCGFLHICGVGANAAAQISLATAVEAEMLAWEDQLKHSFALVEMTDEAQATLATAIASASFKRTFPVAGYVELVSAVRRTLDKRSLAWAVAARVAATDPGRDPSERALGKLRGVVSTYYDEEKTPGLDALGYTTAATYRGRGGVFLKNFRQPAGQTSDYQFGVHRRVMDLALDACAFALFDYVNRALLANGVTGLLAASDADAIDANITGQLRTALRAGRPPAEGGRASAATFRVNRADNLLSSPVLRGAVSVVPLIYPRQISATFSFANPALAALEAA